MSSNRQPKNRTLALTKITLFVNAFYAIAQTLLLLGFLRVSISHSNKGKIEGIDSISTLPIASCWLKWSSPERMDAPHRIMAVKTCICASCYACGAIATYRFNLLRVLVFNYVILSNPLTPTLIPQITNLYCRFNAFGEVINQNHVRWITAIARHNSRTTFSLITKRWLLFTNLRTKPRNLILVASLKTIDDVKDITDRHVDKTYCVVHDLTPYLSNAAYQVCNDKCMNCISNHTGCYSKTGPRVIVRQLQ